MNMEMPIKDVIQVFLIAIIFIFFACSNVSLDAVELAVDFTWEGMVPCAQGGNPEIRVSGVPDGTKVLVVTHYDHSGLYHTKQTLVYDGSSIIKKGSLDEITAPCPFGSFGGSEAFKFKVEAVNGNGVVIGIGSKERYFPEEK